MDVDPPATTPPHPTQSRKANLILLPDCLYANAVLRVPRFVWSWFLTESKYKGKIHNLILKECFFFFCIRDGLKVADQLYWCRNIAHGRTEINNTVVL